MMLAHDLYVCPIMMSCTRSGIVSKKKGNAPKRRCANASVKLRRTRKRLWNTAVTKTTPRERHVSRHRILKPRLSSCWMEREPQMPVWRL